MGQVSSGKRTTSDEGADSSRRARKSAALRERLFRIALRHMVKRGFDGARVDDITREADVAKGTFFNYFATKSDVLVAFWESFVGEVLAHGESVSLSRGGRAAIRSYYRHLARRVEEQADVVSMLVARVGADAPLRRADAALAKREAELMANFLRAGQRSGEFAKRLDKKLAARLMDDLWVGSLREWVDADRGFSLERRQLSKLELLWRGFGK